MEASKPTLEVRHPDVAYEHRDLDHRIVLTFLFFLGCGGLLIHIALWGAFRTLGSAEYAGHQTTNPIMTSNEQLREVGGDPALTFPMPRLQPNPPADLNKFRVREEEQLNSYGWVDRSARRIHIPIERAIDIMASSWPDNEGNTQARTLSPQASQQPHKPEEHE
jgi:hypothetical protein